MKTGLNRGGGASDSEWMTLLVSLCIMLVWTHFITNPMLIYNARPYERWNFGMWFMALFGILCANAMVVYTTRRTIHTKKELYYKIALQCLKITILSLLLLPRVQFISMFCLDKSTHDNWLHQKCSDILINADDLGVEEVKMRYELKDALMKCDQYYLVVWFIIFIAYLFFINVVPMLCGAQTITTRGGRNNNVVEDDALTSWIDADNLNKKRF